MREGSPVEEHVTCNAAGHNLQASLAFWNCAPLQRLVIVPLSRKRRITCMMRSDVAWTQARIPAGDTSLQLCSI